MPASSHASPLPPLSGAEAELRDRLGRHVAVMAGDIGERNLWRHEALEASAGYIEQAFRAAGFEVTSQHYTTQGKTVRNRHSCRVCITAAAVVAIADGGRLQHTPVSRLLRLPHGEMPLYLVPAGGAHNHEP